MLLLCLGCMSMYVYVVNHFSFNGSLFSSIPTAEDAEREQLAKEISKDWNSGNFLSPYIVSYPI